MYGFNMIPLSFITSKKSNKYKIKSLLSLRFSLMVLQIKLNVLLLEF
jgi:hypothetical protein